jgi:hypothetical protein
MSRYLILLTAALGVGAGAGCRDATGVHVIAHVGSLQFDELRVGVTVLAAASPDGAASAGETLVDPATRGRYTGPFPPGDQDVFIYLPDGTGGDRVSCQVTAAKAGAVVAEGANDATVAVHEVKDVEVFLAGAAPPSGSGGAAGSDGAGDRGGAAGGGTGAESGAAGMTGTAGAGGAAGTTPPPPPTGAAGMGGDKGKEKDGGNGGDDKGGGNGNGNGASDDASTICIAGFCL